MTARSLVLAALLIAGCVTLPVRAASKDVDLNGDGTVESTVSTNITNSNAPITYENKVTNRDVGHAFSFVWPSAGPGGFSSRVAAGTTSGVGAIWTWKTGQTVFSYTGTVCTNDICFTRTTPADSYKRGPFKVPGRSYSSTAITPSAQSLSSTLITFFGTAAAGAAAAPGTGSGTEVFRFTSSVNQLAPGAYSFSTAINNANTSSVVVNASPGPYGCGAFCGNHARDVNEDCEGADLGGQTCAGLGFESGTLACTAGCAFDTSGCISGPCNNGRRRGDEVCDGADLGGQTCVGLGGSGGSLFCRNDCTGFDTSHCTDLCGNGIGEGAETCDRSDLRGLTCARLAESFHFSSFSAAAVCPGPACTIAINGSAGFALNGGQQGVLRLTGPALDESGSAWYTLPQPVGNGFRSTFQFQVTPDPKGSIPADGLAFVVQNAGLTALGASGSGIGYSTIPHSVAIEFDMFRNTGLGDPSANHVALLSCGVCPNSSSHTPPGPGCMSAVSGCTSVLSGPLPVNLADGNVHTASVSFTPGAGGGGGSLLTTGILAVSVDGNPVLSASFNLASIGLGGPGDDSAWVGLTAATSSFDQTHDVLSWSFAPYGSAASGALSCNDNCTISVAQCASVCGNGIIEGNEACDGANVGNAGCGEGQAGSVTCDAQCHLDLSGCTTHYCGNGSIDTRFEECDPPAPGKVPAAEHTCGDFGASGGTLLCDAACKLDFSQCANMCGNGLVDAGEICDGANLNGATCQSLDPNRHGRLMCKADCSGFDTSACLPIPCDAPATGFPPVPGGTAFNRCNVSLHPPKEVSSKISVCTFSPLDPPGTCSSVTEGTAQLLVPDLNTTIGPVYLVPVSTQVVAPGGSALVQPGDTVSIFVSLLNAGSAAVRDVSATLSDPSQDLDSDGTPDLAFVNSPVSSYPNGACFQGFPTGAQDCNAAPVIPAACTNIDPFIISIPPEHPADVIRRLVLTVSYSTVNAQGLGQLQAPVNVPIILGVSAKNCPGGLDEGQGCNDGNACTLNDTCLQGVCQGGDALSCNDGNPCTDDSCNPATGCVHTNNTAPCNDGSLCTVNDTCVRGVCQGGGAASCDDGNPCTTDGCAATTGCTHVNNAAPCSDGNLCTLGDRCSAGTCQPGGPKLCSDGNPCTLDLCDPESGCKYLPACSDNNACTADACSSRTGCSHTPVNCNDNNACTSDACNSRTGCSHAQVNCNDNNACTVDSCDSRTGCRHTTLVCNDGNPNTIDTCVPSRGCVFTRR